MSERARDHSDPVLLFEDFLALRAEDKNPDTRAFLVRAGERAVELRDLFTTLQELEDVPNDPDDPSLLFEEYLVCRDRGEKVDFEDFVRRAGSHAEEFRGLISTLQGFEGLSVVLSEPRTVPSEFDALGRFQDLKQIGKGGLSVVFRGYDPRLRREVALKVIEPGGIGIEEVRGSVLAEARSLALLEHDSVVKVYDVDEAEGYDYIEMEYVEGPSLYETLEAMRALGEGGEVADERALAAARELETIPARCRFVARLARALHYCHEKGVIHRDVKPGNVLIEGTKPTIIDFGLAHSETQEDSFGLITQRLIATAPYAAPEQVEQDRTGASAASDQFSLGIVFYELLTLVNPFQKDSQSATLNAIARAEPVPPRKLNQAIPQDVELICRHALEKLPGDRYATIGGIADDLEAFLEYRAISVQPPSGLKQASLWLSRHKRQVIPAVVSAVLVSALGLATWMRPELAVRHESLARVESSLERVPTLDEPTEFNEAFDAIIQESVTCGRQDESLFAGNLLPETMPRLDELRDAVSRQLAEVVSGPFDKADSIAGAGGRSTKFTQFKLEWQVPLELEVSACPGAIYNERFRDLGRLEVPDGATLFVWGGDMFPTWTPVSPTERLPERGFYRLVQPLPNGELAEMDFHFSLVEPSRVLSAQPLGPDYAERMDRIAGSEIELELKYIGKKLVAVDSFRITSVVVTWGDVKDVVKKAYVYSRSMIEGMSQTNVSLEDDAPALLNYIDAQLFATRVGARLPTATELWLANERRALDLPGAPSTQEWVASALFEEDLPRRAAFKYTSLTINERDAGLWLENVPESAYSIIRGFRLAISGD